MIHIIISRALCVICVKQQPQQQKGEMLVHVSDRGEDGGKPQNRQHRTASKILFHTDSADLVGLLCLKEALEGIQQQQCATAAMILSDNAR